MLGVAPDEVLEAGRGARALAQRRARQRSAEARICGERARRVLLQEGLVGARRLGGLAAVGAAPPPERRRVDETLA
jgi:hypothetical protein